MANIQRNGTFSVVPRMPAGEVKPEGLIAIGEVARDYGLYTKITGGTSLFFSTASIDTDELLQDKELIYSELKSKIYQIFGND